MANLKTLYVELATNVRPLVAGMAQGSTAVKRFGKDVAGVGQDLDGLARKAAESSRRVVEAQLRVTAAQERLNTLRASGRASAQQQASAEAQLMAAERNLARAHAQAAESAKAANGGLAALGATGQRTKSILSTVALAAGAVLAGGLLASVHAAAQLEQALYNVASISPEVAADVGHFREVLVQMSTQLPQTAKELAEGFYQIVSSGFQADDALTVLDASARAASAGLTTTEVSAKAISGVLKAYGLSAGSASDVSDVLFKTVQDGVISFEELAQGVGDYVGTGAAAKVSIGELGAAVAAMTLSGVTAAESGTSLNRVLQSIIKPSTALADALHKAGYESGAQALETDGLYKVMEKLRASTGGNVEELLKLFPEIRAARGAFALMAADGQNYSQTFDDIATINGRVGATMQALEQQQQSAAYQTTILKNQAVALGIELGQTLLPTIKFVVGGLHDFLGMMDAMPGPLRSVLTLVMALSAAAALGGGAFIRFRPQIVAFRESLAQMRAQGSMLPTALRGIGIAAGAVGAALIIGTAIYGHYTAAKQKAREATDDFVTALKAEAAGDVNAMTNKVIERLSSGGDLTVLKKWGVDYATFIHGVLGSDQDYLGARQQLWAKVNDSGDVRKLENDLKSNRDWAEAGRLKFAALSSTQQDVAQTARAMAGPLADLGTTAAASADGTQQLTDAQKGLRTALDAMIDSSGAAKTALTGLTDPSKAFTDAQTKAQEAARKAADARKETLQQSQEAELQTAQDAATAASRRAADADKAHKGAARADARAAADRVTSLKRSQKDQLDALDKGASDVKVTLAQWTASLHTSAVEQASWERDLTVVAQRAGVGVADALRSMGKDAIPLVHEIATGTQTEVDQVKKSFAELAPTTRASLTAWTQELAKQVADQAAFVGNLVTLGRRGHGAIAEELMKLPVDQAAPLAAEAARASEKILGPLEVTLRRRAAIAGDGSTEALATAVEGGMQVVALAADRGAAAAADALVQKFGTVQQATLYLEALKVAITDLPTRKVIDIIVNQLTNVTTIGGIPVGSKGPKPSQGHSNDSDIVTGRTDPTAGTGLDLSVGHSYAEGGLRDAQIQPGRGRGLVQWAEAETGGEAFIPLGSSKRPRSAQILHTVARQFGMAVVPAQPRSFANGGGSMRVSGGSTAVVRMDTADVERVARALGNLLPRVHSTEFSGPIIGPTLAEVRAEAERETARNNLRGLR